VTDRPLDPPGIETRGVTVRYGGLVAADAVTLTAPKGQVTGLIGPNGAGKTTTFAACSGLVAPSEGTVHLFGQDVTKQSSQGRGQMGLGRTFQRMELFDSLTVRENIALGYEAGLAGSKPWRHLRASRSERSRTAERVEEALRRCDLMELADTTASDLSTGQGRLVELARVIAGDFTMLLLDEPSSGLDRTETARFGEIIRALIKETGTGILIVEHDMSLVLTVCDYIYVLDFGKLIFEGTPADIMASSEVQAAYLGSSELEAS
jgi:ABC-type branched-subunit amino acid transport system ATPase component